MSPFGATTRFLADPRLSAMTSAQNPDGRVRPPLSGSHDGRARCSASDAGMTRAQTDVRVSRRPRVMPLMISEAVGAAGCGACVYQRSAVVSPLAPEVDPAQAYVPCGRLFSVRVHVCV